MITTRARGSDFSREATSSRHALSTLFRRSRFAGNDPAVQVTAGGAFGFSTLNVHFDSAVPPRPSETRTVTVADEPGSTPVESQVALAPVPDTLPALADHS